MTLIKKKIIAPTVLGLMLLASSAYAATSATANLSAPANSAVSNNVVSINGNVKVTAWNNGGYNMDAQAVQSLIGPDITRASFAVVPKGSISKTKNVPASVYYAKAKPSYINHKDGYGWTSGRVTITNG